MKPVQTITHSWLQPQTETTRTITLKHRGAFLQPEAFRGVKGYVGGWAGGKGRREGRVHRRQGPLEERER